MLLHRRRYRRDVCVCVCRSVCASRARSRDAAAVHTAAAPCWSMVRASVCVIKHCTSLAWWCRCEVVSLAGRRVSSPAVLLMLAVSCVTLTCVGPAAPHSSWSWAAFERQEAPFPSPLIYRPNIHVLFWSWVISLDAIPKSSRDLLELDYFALCLEPPDKSDALLSIPRVPDRKKVTRGERANTRPDAPQTERGTSSV